MCSKDELLNRDNSIRKSNGVLKFIFYLVLGWLVLPFGLKTTGYGQEIPSTPTTLGYRNFFYKTGSVTSEVTEEKPQSNVWHNDGFWWGVLWEPNTKVYRIHRYNLGAHSWVNVGPDVDDRPRSAADVLWDGSKLYIASNAKLSHTSSQGTENIKIYRYSYNSGTDTHSLDNGFPVQLSNSGKTRSVTIAKDSNAKLWVTWTENAKVMVNRTLGSDINWGTAFVLPAEQNDLKLNTNGTTTGTPVSTLGQVSLNQTVEFDLTAAITGNGTFSFAITNQHSNTVKYSSKEGVSVPELIVTTGSGGGGSNPPVIRSFNPNSGAVGAEVTLTGSFFTGTTGVAFNGTTASFVFDSDSQLRATLPAGAATGKIRVTTGKGAAASASDFTVNTSSNFPSVASFTPNSGPVGTAVTIAGADLSGSTTVAFNGLPAVFTLDSDSQIRATVPSGATTGKISVSNGARTVISGLDFTVVTGGSGGTLSFQVAEDAYVRSSRLTSNYGSDNELKVRTSSAIRSAYLKFNVNGVSGPITSAVIRMQVINGSNDGGSVFSVSNNYLNTATLWDEEGLVWSNAPAITGTALNSAGAVVLNQVVEFDVTAAIIGDSTFSFAIRSNSSNLANYSSKEGVRAPELVVSTAVSKQKTETNGHTNDELVETDDAVLPTELALFPNYPNPFNAETNIEYALPQDAQVKLGIFNIRGQLIKILVDAEQEAGIKRVRWAGKNRDEKDVGSGVYFLRLNAGEHKFSRKITLQK